MTARIVITGMGIVNASGIGVEPFWRSVSAGRLAIRAISRFDASTFPVRVAGEVDCGDALKSLPRRLVNKTDRFAHFALIATAEAIASAQIKLDRIDREKAGVWFGNNSGGWDIHEQGLRELSELGPRMVNPWQATSWFPTAAQGHTSILHQLFGNSKSFVADRASGAGAIVFGLRSIRQGQNHMVLAGGTEAPITSLGVACYYASGDLVAAVDPHGAYRPFDARRCGLVLGEGSAVLVLEDLEHALARKAPILAEIKGARITTDSDPGRGRALERGMRMALQEARLRPIDIDLVFAEGAGSPVHDRVEAEAMENVWGGDSDKIVVTVPKSLYGHGYGASGATEIICGILAARTRRLPPTAGYEVGDPGCRVRPIGVPREATVKNFMVNARSRNGVNVSIVVEASSQE